MGSGNNGDGRDDGRLKPTDPLLPILHNGTPQPRFTPGDRIRRFELVREFSSNEGISPMQRRSRGAPWSRCEPPGR